VFFVLFCLSEGIGVSAIWPFCPVEQLFLHVDSIGITLSCDHLCSQIKMMMMIMLTMIRIVSHRVLNSGDFISLMSGVNPQSVRGSRTGVFIGRSVSETHEAWTAVDGDHITGYEMTGCTGSMLSNRISYFFDFTGLYCDTTVTTTLLLL